MKIAARRVVVIGLLVACHPSEDESERDKIAACQAKGGFWNDQGCSAGHCEFPSGLTSAAERGAESTRAPIDEDVVDSEEEPTNVVDEEASPRTATD